MISTPDCSLTAGAGAAAERSETQSPVPEMHGRSPRLLFCSYCSYLDHSSGAALATRDLLELLAKNGWECSVFSGPHLDDRTPLEAAFRKEDLPFQFRPGTVSGQACTLYHADLNGVAFHGFVPASSSIDREPAESESAPFLHLLTAALQRFRPDIVLTYGSSRVAGEIMQRGRQAGAKTVFAIHNMDYREKATIAAADAVFVPSEAARKHYETTLGIRSTALPGPWNPERFLCADVKGEFVTFVNPQPYKGAFWVARIAYEMDRRRPDIPFLIVDGRGKAEWLGKASLDLSGLSNLKRMFNTADPRKFYQISRLVLVPSLCADAHPRVAVEAIMNGIPVLASRRGGLPEILAHAGFLFDMPAHYPPQSLETPTAEEVRPWVEIIERLWDDKVFFEQERKRCQQAAEAWQPATVFRQFDSFFASVLSTRCSGRTIK